MTLLNIIWPFHSRSKVFDIRPLGLIKVIGDIITSDSQLNNKVEDITKGVMRNIIADIAKIN